jgi:hypothetical protein
VQEKASAEEKMVFVCPDLTQMLVTLRSIIGESAHHGTAYSRLFGGINVGRGTHPMMAALGLQRAKIAATFHKRPLAHSMGVAVECLCAATKTRRKDFRINVDLNIHIQDGTPLEKHARINVYVSSDVGNRVNDAAGKVVPLDRTRRVRIPATLDEMTIARAMAWVVKTLVTSVQAEKDDFWVNVDLDVHVKRGKAYEKKARINVYGDLIDPCGTTVVESIDWNEVPAGILAALCEDFEETQG